jgi:hypothetical protein
MTITSSLITINEPTNFTNGNVGIGTTSPDAKLNITAGNNGAALLLEAENSINLWKNITFKTYVSESQAANFSAGSHIYTTSPGGATTWPFTEYGALVIEGRDDGNSGIALRTGNGSGQITRIAIRESGNVGIGTTSPGSKLDVSGGDIRLSTNATYLRSKDSASAIPRVLGMNASNAFYIGPIDSYAGGGIIYGASSNVSYHGFYGGGSEKVRITSAGIGTTSPLSQLTVQSSNATAYDATIDDGQDSDGATIMAFNTDNTTTNSFAQILFRNRSSNVGVSRIVSLSTAAASTALAFVTENNNTKAEKMRITSSGNVGIGTTSPGKKLDITQCTLVLIKQVVTLR